MKLALPTLIGAASALAACTDYYPPPPGPPPEAAAGPPMAEGCFRSSDIDNHTIGDDRTLYIRVANRDVYRLEMVGACLGGAGPSDPIVMREPPGTPYVCRPIDLDISIARGGGGASGATPCIVQSMVRLTPDEVAALPDRLRP